MISCIYLQLLVYTAKKQLQDIALFIVFFSFLYILFMHIKYIHGWSINV